jgi:hypothetical protein
VSVQQVGVRLGAVVAPLFAAGSAIRKARLFHPVGVFFAARVEAKHEAATALEGGAILRFSGAIWRRERSPDLLGLAIRFRQGRPLGPEPDPADQDLLLVTFLNLLEIPTALLRTDPHDFLANRYTGGAPFRVAGLGSVRIQVRPEHPSVAGRSRNDRLLRTAEEGQALLHLEAVPSDRAPVPLALLRVGAPLDLTDRETAFHPFRTGGGLVPEGFVHGLRQKVYPASQRARPS